MDDSQRAEVRHSQSLGDVDPAHRARALDDEIRTLTSIPGGDEQIVDPLAELQNAIRARSVSGLARTAKGERTDLVEPLFDERNGEHAVLDADPHAAKGEARKKRLAHRTRDGRRGHSDEQLGRVASDKAELDPVLFKRRAAIQVSLGYTKSVKGSDTDALDPLLVLAVRRDPHAMSLGLESLAKGDVCARDRSDHVSFHSDAQREFDSNSQGCTSPLDPIVKHVICIDSFGLKSRNVDSVLVNITGGR